ncbi:MAG: FeoC-like transcriptional regulator, partial [Phormidesmis sp.]
LQQYLRTHHKVSMTELQLRFQMEADPLRDILNRLIRKGRASREDGKLCGGCRSCEPEAIEFYSWVERSKTACS